VADYDVGVVALTTPAPSAPLAQCRPVVSVRNNGIHEAIASGYIRIYSAGLLVYESEAYSDTIGPGETRPASAVAYWTPEAEGTYMVQGYFSTPLDQVEPNNNLWPTTAIISGIEPPPPTPVPLHASQHESGGPDEMSIEDLPGRAGDAQLPINHASFHENAGIDRIDVTGLPGVLGAAQNPKTHAGSHKVSGSDPLDVLALPNVTALELVARKGAANGYSGLDAVQQVPRPNLARVPANPTPAMFPRYDGDWGIAETLPHSSSHENGGDDELSVEGLSGVLYNLQKPQVHDNEKHDPNYASVTALQAHLDDTTNVHPTATNLEQTAHKGAANGYAGLDVDQLVPRPNLARVPVEPDASMAPRYDGDWGPVQALALNATGAAVSVAFDAPETTIATFTVPAGWMNSSLGVILNLAGRLTTAIGVGALLRFKVKQGAAVLVQHDVDVNKNSVAPVSVHGYIAAIDAANLKAFLEFMADSDAVQHLGTHVATTAAGTGYTAAETVFTITAQFVNGAAVDLLLVDVSHSFHTGQPS